MYETHSPNALERRTMTKLLVHQCECSACQEAVSSSEQSLHQQMNLLLSRLDEQQRRFYAAVESLRMGHGGDLQVARITGLDVKTIRRGRQELDEELASRPTDRIRLPGGGRRLAEKKTRR